MPHRGKSRAGAFAAREPVGSVSWALSSWPSSSVTARLRRAARQKGARPTTMRPKQLATLVQFGKSAVTKVRRGGGENASSLCTPLPDDALGTKLTVTDQIPVLRRRSPHTHTKRGLLSRTINHCSYSTVSRSTESTNVKTPLSSLSRSVHHVDIHAFCHAPCVRKKALQEIVH